MICPRCHQELVEVDNPMRREVRHRRGVVCKPVPPISDELLNALILPQSPIRGRDIDLEVIPVTEVDGDRPES